jgi:hypothetical protein
MKARSGDRKMSQDTEGAAQVYADRLAKRGRDPAPSFVERGGGTIVDIASLVTLAPEILEGIYGLEDDAAQQVADSKLVPRGTDRALK